MITPLVLVGGEGRRLWPLSTPARPKPFLPLMGPRSLLQETLARLAPSARLAPPIIIGAAEHGALIAEQASEAPGRRIVLEPAPRSTAPAAAVGALMAEADDPDALVLIAPADHLIADAVAFHAALAAGATAAREGAIVLFGATPAGPLTGFGYIAPGESAGAVRPVARFVEKPGEAEAAALIANGGLWNCGIFLVAARTLVAELETHAPDVLGAARAALAGARREGDIVKLEPAGFAAAPCVSLDIAVIEKTARAAVLRADFSWSDVGAWSSLWAALPKDADGNATRGPAVVEDACGNLIFAEGLSVAAAGLRDMIVVATPERVLIVPRNRDQQVRALADRADGL